MTNIERLKRLNRRLDILTQQRRWVADHRRRTVDNLITAGWSLQQIADEVGLSKSAIAKIAK